MTVSLFTFVDMYARVLGSADHLLTRGVSHAEETGGSGEDVLDWRLIDDMHPVRFQLQTLCNFAQEWPARAIGIPAPKGVDLKQDVAGFRAALSSAQAFLADLRPEQFEGRDDVQLPYNIAPGMEPVLPAGQWLSVFATTNIYFHLMAAYAILRAKGVPLGKADLFSAGI